MIERISVNYYQRKKLLGDFFFVSFMKQHFTIEPILRKIFPKIYQTRVMGKGRGLSPLHNNIGTGDKNRQQN